MRILLSLFLFFISSNAFLQQSVAVKGKLLCGNHNLAGAKVKLWDKNRLGQDDLLAEGVTDINGNFQLQGTNGVFKMNVFLKIYHDCEDSIKPCQRKVSFQIPDSFVSRSSTPALIFNASVLNMAIRYPDEERSCIN
ncbi:ttr-38 [Pristionchus pacificus]|uniref:Ttr-38 n=1 Tax=Pristionchus pacificus TaxID=54126 RepID=A0A2A6BZ57_PRIPA|nr:ttr-38 [Pristionchus pacificus]|eukprot:PDM71224.1 ttr-38 [Pristionchus pacificus]